MARTATATAFHSAPALLDSILLPHRHRHAEHHPLQLRSGLHDDFDVADYASGPHAGAVIAHALCTPCAWALQGHAQRGLAVSSLPRLFHDATHSALEMLHTQGLPCWTS